VLNPLDSCLLPAAASWTVHMTSRRNAQTHHMSGKPLLEALHYAANLPIHLSSPRSRGQ
jgi:hypothetical protein